MTPTTNPDELAKIAARLRLDVMEMVYEVKDGHPGPAFSIAEIVTALYFGGILTVNPADPLWNERDRFILSKGHACTILYAALARRGFFPVEELLTFRKIDSRIQGHPYMYKTPGNDGTTGSLGNGMATALGVAKGLKIQGIDARSYAVIGDGECNEGIIWECIMAATNLRLSNFIVFLDANSWQSGGSVKEVSGLEDLPSKVQSFGWNVLTIDGHDFTRILDAVATARSSTDRPTMIIARTEKGHGLDYTAGDNSWHKRVPDDAQMTIAREQLTREFS